MRKVFFVGFGMMLMSGLGFAQGLLEEVTKDNKNIFKKTGNDLDSVGYNTIELFLKVAIALGISFAIWSGIQYVLAAGDEAKASKATKTLVFVGIGLAIAMSAYFLLQLAQQAAQSL